MKSKLNFGAIVIVALALLLVPSVAARAEDAIERAVEACKPEIETYCSQVTPGEGRMLACFVAHEDKISGTCSWALYETMAELEAFVNAIAYVASSCQNDLMEHCGDVQMGEGRVGVCLLEHKEEVSEACSMAMDDVEMEMVEE